MPRIVYLSWPAGEISGGVKAAFGHVEVLRAAGMDAVIVTADGMAPTWFGSTAPVVPLDAVRPDDVLVFPENDAALLQRFAGTPQPKLVFCQNPAFVWRGLDEKASYADFGVQRILCVSHTVAQFCRRRFPGIALAVTPYFVDHERFICPPTKKLQIACVPRKRPTEAMAVRDLFRALAPAFAMVPWVLVQQASEAKVAEAMGESAVFLSLARLEAHSMTTLEAMACGCLVAGFIGNSGPNDSATAANGLWAPEDDLQACADRLVQAVGLVREQGPLYQGMVANARRTAAAYRREEVGRQVAAVWRGILADTAA
jgi:hypothetical protein